MPIGQSGRRARIALCAAAAAAAVIAVQAGHLAGAWDVAPRESGRLTFALDRQLGAAAIHGARDAFAAWDAANTGLVMVETAAWSSADVRVAEMEVSCFGGEVVNGCACASLSALCPEADNMLRGWSCRVPDGATIGVAQGVYDTDGTMVVYTREDMRDLVAHEFGHNLGLVHNGEDSSHLMHGRSWTVPYSDRGYVLPEPISVGGHVPEVPAVEIALPESCGAP